MSHASRVGFDGMMHSFWRLILDDELLTRGLNDPEARLLIDWLVERTEVLANSTGSDEAIRAKVTQLRLRARAISKFVHLWCHQQNAAGAFQLAAAQRFSWPLPNRPVDPCDLMSHITSWEESKAA